MHHLRIGFLVGDLTHISGGLNVIFEHARGLTRRGCHVTLISATAEAPRASWHRALAALECVSIDEAESIAFDFVFATWWLTVFDLGRLRSRVYGYFNQSLESRFHPETHYKQLNRCTYAMPLFFVTEAAWLAQFITLLQPTARIALVRNGFSREYFPPVSELHTHAGPLRVLVEGPWGMPFKMVGETFDILAATTGVNMEIGWLSSNTNGQRPRVAGGAVGIFERIPIHEVAAVLRAHDVMIKLSRVEGVFGPPLEMFSQGGTAITSTVSGSDDYIVHGYNALVVPPYAQSSVSEYLRLLDRNRPLLETLKKNAIATARASSTWEESSDVFWQHLLAARDEQWSNAAARPQLLAWGATKERWLALEQKGQEPLGEVAQPPPTARRSRTRRLFSKLPASLKTRVRQWLS